MIRWDKPGYVVAFTTRGGGVSEGVYASLNLTKSTGDDPACVERNRELACEAVGIPFASFTFNRQLHSATVLRANAGVQDQPGDGLWSDEVGVSMLATSADCVPIAIARTGEPRALAVLHAGWRGLSGGIVAAGVARLHADSAQSPGLTAIIGPAIGPCCYEVGDEVSSLFDDDLTHGRRLDLWGAAERALRAAGVERVERVDLCTKCHPDEFFSHRRDGLARGVQGVLGALA